MSRNHFAKAYSVAEALSRQLEVELVSFRFFEDPIFPPLAARAAASRRTTLKVRISRLF
jgi:hypothetical protein